MNALDDDWRRLRNILGLLLVFASCLYLPSLFYEAFADDDIYLAFANLFLRESHWSDLYRFFLRPANPWEFLPLRDLSYWLDFRLYGDELNGFHATNLLWYGASSLASFWLFRELILYCKPTWESRASILSLCGTLLFVVHPAHIEVVAWIASRKELIGGTLGFMAVALLTRALRQQRFGHQMVVAAIVLFAACFGKASAMTFILFVTLLIGMNWSESTETNRGKLLSISLLFWTLVAAAFVIHFNISQSTEIRIENHPGLWTMLDRASRILAALIGILLFPYPMRFYYDVYQLGAWHWLISIGTILISIVALRILWQRRSLWALGVVLAFTPMLIYLQLIPFTTWSLASERFIFVPIAGLSLVLIDLFGRMKSPNKIARLLLIIVLPCAAIVWSRIAEWSEIPSALLLREYTLQPGFHNAIRDRIVFKLLPERKYAEAAELARQLSRPYAVRGLLSLIKVEQAYQQMGDAKSTNTKGENEARWQNFCGCVAEMRLATRDGYAQIPSEADISYNNILRTLDQQLRFRYNESKKCMSPY